MSLYSRSFPLVLFLPFLILPGNPARANDDPTECKACSANATSLQAVKDVLGAGDENDPSKLSKEELKEIEKSRKELVENKLVSRQKYTYNEQAYEFKRYAFAYRRVFGSDEKDPEKLFKIIASSDSVDQAVKNAKLKAKKLDDPKVQEAIALLKDSHNRIWYRDPELKSLTSRLFVDPDKQEKLVANLVKAHFKDEKRIAEMDRLLTSQYIEAKQQYLAKKKKKSFSKEDLKNLDITFNLEPPVAGAPSDDYKTLNLSELQDLAVQKSAGTDHASIFCQPLPNNPKYLNEDDPVLAGKSGVDPEFSTSPPQTEYQDILHQDTCDLKQTFPPDSAEVTADSRKVLQDCLARAKSNPDCAGGITSISAKVRSCADTRISGKFASNLDLSDARSGSMAKAFSDETKSLLGMDAVATRDDDTARAAYENLYYNDQGSPVLTGTCGPRPPKGYATESWMPSSRDFCSVNPNPEKLKECLAIAPANQRWRCDPAQDFKKVGVNDYYQGFRMAGLEISYTCKKTIAVPVPGSQKGDGVAFESTDPRKKFMDSIACGVFVKCFSPKVRISTAEPVKHSSGGGGFDFSWDRIKRPAKSRDRSKWGSTDCYHF